MMQKKDKNTSMKMSGGMGYAKGGKVTKKPAPKFKPCAKCPNPTKCKAMGSCMMKGKK
jgi:hypothetical protein